jgi:hypothetical protein
MLTHVDALPRHLSAASEHGRLLNGPQHLDSGRLDQFIGARLVPARDVDQHYIWSPTGRWVVVRHGDYRGGDKIYLVNPADPTQTVDVVLADRGGQQMTDPIWSPDGKTLIVFTVQYGASQPYQLDIGTYLRSKGLEP